MPVTVQNPLVIFLPETGIEPYVRSLAIVADAARVLGQRVLLTKCTGQMAYCSMMAMYEISVQNVEKEKKRLCPICSKMHSEVCQKYGFETLDIAQLSISVDEITQIIAAHPQDLGAVKYYDFPVGDIAAYDFSLLTKYLFNVDVSPEHKAVMHAYVLNTMLCIAYGKNLLQRITPSAVLCFNEYASCQAMRFCANNSNIPFISVTLGQHIGTSGSLFVCTKEILAAWSFKHLAQWPSVRHLPIAIQYVYACFDDVLFRSYGNNSHLFSPNKNCSLDKMCADLGIDISKKICVVYTSSLDERYGLDSSLNLWNVHPGKEDAFDSQIEWLQALRTFAASRDDVQIVVRVHPREGTRKRNGISEHLVQMRATFTDPMDNVIIVWPDDPISSYDLMELADVALVAWSSMGAESFRVGVPVLSWAGNMYYVDSDCVRVATTKESYFATLEKILSQVPTFNQLREGIRYYYWRTFISCLDMSETVDSNPYLSSYWPKAPASLCSIIQDIVQGEAMDPVANNVLQWNAALNGHSQDYEQSAIVNGIRALIEVTFYPPQCKTVPLWFRLVRKCVRIFAKKTLVWRHRSIPRVQDFSHLQLECLSGQQDDNDLKQRTRNNKNLRVLVSNDNINVYYKHGICRYRTSKLISRLGNYVAAFISAAQKNI